MKNKYQFLMLILAVALSMAPITGYAQQSAINDDNQINFIPDLHKQILSSLLKMSDAFGINDMIRAKHEVSASNIRNDEQATQVTRHHDPTSRPFIQNPFYIGSMSFSMPFAITQSLTIAPSVTYAFLNNDTNRLEYKGKGLINLINKDSAIVYGGIHFHYSF